MTPEWPRAGVGFLGGEQQAPSHQLGERCKELGSAVSSPVGSGLEPRKICILGPQKSRQNGQLAFESGRGNK